MATLRPIGSNSLTFIWSGSPLSPNDFNRHYGGIDYYNKYFIQYYQKVQQTDDLWFQLRTDYSQIKVELVNASNGTTSTLTATPIGYTTDETKQYFNIDIPTSSLDGCYYVYITADQDADKPIVYFISNTFEVRSEHKNTLLIEWANNAAYDDGFLWSDRTQELRLNCRLVDDIGGASVSTYVDDNNNEELLDYHPEYGQNLVVEEVPRDIAHLLNRIVGHDIFAINGIEYTRASAFDFGDRFGDSRLYAPTLEVKVKNYENYAQDDELTGDLPVIPSASLAFDATTSLAFDTATSLAFTE